ncbi:flagellar hook-basal body complex protein FliE [Shewanella fidelis]|uniref:Flagellar hook-basal body complex protein FliE n=1 Tax=Shewanella fidelis TaxID=173509 RepID=A0AAW8NTW4_9GAMM|nr:flagellar hook-basal body complex protein FliE [Shewanella fidelis]MDR8525930.1 flagellar hook-basal body complex protein FliE [Shewanella fidelis]MDW4813882.1 flagellar hook-basal body complex protein FliE [Shewanella fidelis]MDW4817926.1 flagellar hook-basal body complex protein FliE [Shewanella fidelis]MDW4821993.1 flagellar hook-basal body complex protein FliE [Shewanella fidelis]MDW4826158.1 flagellar hook-basal body complex protein FliE [Shewanella fidelis]
MSNASITSPQLLMQQMSIHTEMAQGAIKVGPNPRDFGFQPASFTELMKQKVSAINADQNASSALVSAVDSGQSSDLVGAMVASQKASLSFSAMIQIRNRLVQAFDDVMKMPI